MSGNWFEQGHDPLLDKAGSVGAANLAAGAVTSDKLGALAVTPDKLAPVTLPKLSGLIVAAYLGAPILATDNRIVTSTNLTNAAKSIANQPDVPRNLTVTITDTTVSITAGLITIVGTAPDGSAVTEVFNLAGPTLSFTGAQVFASVTSVTPSGCTVLGGAGDELIKVGVGNLIGLPTPIQAAAAVKHVYLAGVRQTSPGVAAGPPSTVDANAGTYNGTKAMWCLYDVGG